MPKERIFKFTDAPLLREEERVKAVTAMRVTKEQ